MKREKWENLLDMDKEEFGMVLEWLIDRIPEDKEIQNLGGLFDDFQDVVKDFYDNDWVFFDDR